MLTFLQPTAGWLPPVGPIRGCKDEGLARSPDWANSNRLPCLVSMQNCFTTAKCDSVVLLIRILLAAIHTSIIFFCSSKTNSNSLSRDCSRTTAPAIHFSEHMLPPSSSRPPQSSEDSLPPHLLLPDSISQLEEFGRQKKWHKKQYKNHRQRQFNDLWVRIEDG